MSWLLAMCIPYEAVRVSDRPQCEHIALTTQCYEMAAVASMLEVYIGVWTFILLLSAGSQCDSRVCAVFVPGCVSLLVLAARVRHCHVVAQDCVTAFMHLSCTCKFKFSSLQLTNSIHVCFYSYSSCH